MRKTRRICGAGIAIVLASMLIANARAANDQAGGEVYSQALADLNIALASAGVTNVQIDKAEIQVTVDGVNAAQTLIANNRTHQIESQFVERDPRRGGLADISYLVDQSDGSALAFANPTGNAIVTLPNTTTEPVIDAAMLRWQNQPACPGPAVTKIADDGSDPDLVDGLVAGNPALIGTPRADVTHAGWLPPSFFNAIAPPNGAASILGVTFTFIFVDDDGNPTDLDHNGRSDTAFREIYYNLGFGWSEGPSRPRGIDIASVSTHESGHAFGLGHFGKVFLDNNGVLKFAPRAVMNAVYASPFADLVGTDNASFCSIWANGR